MMYSTIDNVNKCEAFAKRLRQLIIEEGHNVGRLAIHYGSALSMADMLATLYGAVMHYDAKHPDDDSRDRLILSKGHAYPALYAALCLAGFFSEEELMDNFMTDGGIFPAHPVKNVAKGIECSSGSLGMGLSFGVGKALTAKKRGKGYMTYVLLGDGECEEGSVMEAMLAAAQLKLDNLVAFIDSNKLQQDGTTAEVMHIDFKSLLQAMGWNVIEIDGNNIREILLALDSNTKDGRPFAIVGNTVKGKGVSFMENDNKWHHGSLNKKQYVQAMEELA